MLEKKLAKLEEIVRGKESVVVAFSGGVDSALLAYVSYNLLGKNALAVTIDSASLPREELRCAKKVAKEIGIGHIVVKHSELKNKRLVKNPINRCYYCKREMLGSLKKIARKEGFSAVFEGTNASELRGHRPGKRAVKELRAVSPLAEAGLTKNDVRELAKRYKLSVAKKPSMACLSSRIPVGKAITAKKLKRVELAESYLRKIGVKQLRVRHHGALARIEVLPADFSKVMKARAKIYKKFSGIGFKYVTLDVMGYPG